MTLVALDACGRYTISALKRDDAPVLYAVSDAGVGAVRSVYSTSQTSRGSTHLVPSP